MAEGGERPIIYHIEKVESLNVVQEQRVTNIDKSSFGSLSIGERSQEEGRLHFFIEDI